MKNNNQKESKTNNIQGDVIVEEVKDNGNEDVNLRIIALEEKMGVYEEKIDMIAAYLENINSQICTKEIEKVTEKDANNETGENVSVNASESIIAKNVYELARKDLYEELLPLVECAKKYKNKEERDKVIKMMILTEEMADAADKADEMDEVIEKYPALKNSSDLMEKYVTAYVILKGRDACLNDKEKSVDELMDIFDNNEEFRKAVSLKIREDIKKQNSVPNMNFEGGITSLNIEEKPKNMQDAKNATFRLFK